MLTSAQKGRFFRLLWAAFSLVALAWALGFSLMGLVATLFIRETCCRYVDRG